MPHHWYSAAFVKVFVAKYAKVTRAKWAIVRGPSRLAAAERRVRLIKSTILLFFTDFA